VVAVAGIGGYSAGDGLETKLRLLELERGVKI
jgi:O6-methylguanine-DNA--protein-cysteine methyltransferase